MTLDEFQNEFKGNHDVMHEVFHTAALEQGCNANMVHTHFEDFNMRIGEMVQKMTDCKTCKAGEKCDEHVF